MLKQHHINLFYQKEDVVFLYISRYYFWKTTKSRPNAKLWEKKFCHCKSVHLPHSKPTQHNSYQLPLCLRLLPKLPTTALMISRGRLLQYLMDLSLGSSKLYPFLCILHIHCSSNQKLVFALCYCIFSSFE